MRRLPRIGRPSKGRRTLRRLVRQIPRLIALVGRMLGDARVPAVDKAIFAFVLAYIIAPLDLIPDFLIGIGYADDLYLLGLALHRLFAGAGGRVLLEHWHGDAADLELLVHGVDEIGAIIPAPVRGELHGALRKVRRRARLRPQRSVGDA